MCEVLMHEDYLGSSAEPPVDIAVAAMRVGAAGIDRVVTVEAGTVISRRSLNCLRSSPDALVSSVPGLQEPVMETTDSYLCHLLVVEPAIAEKVVGILQNNDMTFQVVKEGAPSKVGCPSIAGWAAHSSDTPCGEVTLPGRQA